MHSLTKRREVLGDDYVDKALENMTEFQQAAQDFVTEHAWGGIWDRPGLDRKQRSLVVITILASGGHLKVTV